MNIMLGNLTMKQMLERTGIVELVPEESVNEMEAYRSNNTNISKGRYHIYDMPFAIVCYDNAVAKKIINIINPYAGKMTEPIQVFSERVDE